MLIPHTFIWSDGPRPASGEVDTYTNLPVRMNLHFDILQIQDPGNPRRWADAILGDTTLANQKKGTRTLWMLWAQSNPDKCRNDILYLDNLFALGVIPNGVQWDAEEQWRAGDPYQECAQILNDGCKMLNDKYGVSLEYSITAGTWYPHPKFHAPIEHLLSMPMFTVGYSMSYKFWNPTPGHWSHDLPKDPKECVRLTAMAWVEAVKAGILGGCYIGLAAYYQDFPEDQNLPPYTAMVQCIECVYDIYDENPGTVLGLGHWSRKHTDENDEKQTILYNGTQDLRGGRPLTPLPKATRNAVWELQVVLTEAGYGPGPIDGKDGPQTQAAVAQYEEEEDRVSKAKSGGVDELITEVYG